MKKRVSVHYHLMLLPTMALVAAFSIYPLFGLMLAFQEFNPGKGIWGSTFIGLENFKYMFEIPDIKTIFMNTLSIAVMKILATQLLALAFALLLNEVKNAVFKKSIQTIVYLPHFISWVLLGGIVINVLSLDGIVNEALGKLGISPIFFLGSNGWFPGVIVGTHVWQEFGFSAIIYLAALTGINPSLYEAAGIDGAGRLKQLLYVTMPGIATTIILLLTLDMQNVLNAGFEQILNLYNPMVYQTGDIIDTYVYRAGLKELQYELATAVGLLKSVVSLILITISYFLASKFANYRIF
ncbi:ABC transporter permease [Paenibacillus sacheonensis]|uniref:ABC transporter permease subunit n=1 Tax=Paenibacillus sacheonensis TaxID=742054 RepID=A0A7X4YJU2_9BACL|nr:ABC transporter permease subunit [Paenibacillus sacheonensis]MBM7564020.1 putative aldouronate transport system permease protein [Paenibacillus sacheonensis]NBC67645.1 ABC transporter permease subunit [Paenibacillus sacheonensis]